MLLVASIVGLFLLPSPWNVLGVCAAAVVEVVEIWFWIKFLGRYRVHGGAEGLVGERAVVLEACDPDGRVRVHGEIWAAIADGGAPIPAGARARVVGVDGLAVRVVPEGPRT